MQWRSLDTTWSDRWGPQRWCTGLGRRDGGIAEQLSCTPSSFEEWKRETQCWTRQVDRPIYMLMYVRANMQVYDVELGWFRLYVIDTYSLHDILRVLKVLCQCGIGVGILLLPEFLELTDIRLFMYKTIMHKLRVTCLREKRSMTFRRSELICGVECCRAGTNCCWVGAVYDCDLFM